MPAVGTSLFLIGAGAILRYAVTVTVTGISLKTVGLILMIVGGAGLVIALAVTWLHMRDRGPGPPRQPGIGDGGPYR